jgi:hypothetical protein
MALLYWVVAVALVLGVIAFAALLFTVLRSCRRDRERGDRA